MLVKIYLEYKKIIKEEKNELSIQESKSKKAYR
jgi:hypothetical protein